MLIFSYLSNYYIQLIKAPKANASTNHIIQPELPLPFVSVDDVKEAARAHNEPEKFFDYLGSIARQELTDIGTEWFKGAEIQFAKESTFMNCT